MWEDIHLRIQITSKQVEYSTDWTEVRDDFEDEKAAIFIKQTRNGLEQSIRKLFLFYELMSVACIKQVVHPYKQVVCRKDEKLEPTLI